MKQIGKKAQKQVPQKVQKAEKNLPVLRTLLLLPRQLLQHRLLPPRLKGKLDQLHPQQPDLQKKEGGVVEEKKGPQLQRRSKAG